jgi:hypothetical protein
MNKNLMATLNRLAKWRFVFASWQLGTRPDTDPTCRAVRDHREVTILLRAEQNAMLNLCVAKGLFTIDEFEAQLEKEATHLDATYQRVFPGFRATDTGISINTAIAKDTTSGWLP